MVVVRATEKVLKRARILALASGCGSTTTLGDWYANFLFTRRARLILLVSERSLLPLLLQARDWASFGARFRAAVTDLLAAVGASASGVAAEVAEMEPVTFGRTESRSVLGSMNDFAFQARSILETRPSLGLTDLALELSQIPCGPIDYRLPGEVAVALLSGPRRVESV